MVDVRNKRCDYDGCLKQASYGAEGSRKTEFCSEHKRASMVNVTSKLCAYNGCPKRPSYGTEGSRKAELCREHKTAGMVNVSSKRCAYHGCSKVPSFGTEGGKGVEFCSEHKRAGMVDVRNKRCGHQGCSKIPSYGPEGSTKAEVCSEHKRAGMVDLRNKRCGHHGCSKFSSYGTEGSTKTEFCSEHKGAGMVNVKSKRCAYRGCSKIPSFGTEGSSKSEFCGEHKRTGLVNVRSKRCASRGCSKFPSFGTEGSSKVEFCSKHKRAGMVNVSSKRCGHHGCSKFPSFGTGGGKDIEFCSEHKRAGMVSVSSKRCAYHGCSRLPLYGRVGTTKAEFCGEHERAGVVDGSKKTCASEGCVECAVYSPDGSRRQSLLCSRHLTERYHAGASAVASAKARGEAKEVGGVEAGWQVLLPNTRNRPLRVERSPRQVQKASKGLECGPSKRKRILVLAREESDPSQEAHQAPGSVDCGLSKGKRMRYIEREKSGASQEAHQVSVLIPKSSPTPSPTAFTPLASQRSSDQSRAAHNLGEDDRATSREPKRLTRSGCGRDDVRDLPIDTCVAAAKPAQVIPTQGIARTDTAEGKVTASTRITASVDHALARCGGGERDDAVDGDALITSPFAGAERIVSTLPSQGRRHIRKSCASDLQDLRKIASLKKAKREAVVEVNNLLAEVEELKKQVADAAVDRAHAVDEATGKVEEKYTEISQALRDELGAASRVSKDSKGALEAACKERKAFRQQIQAQVAVAASKIKAEAAKTEKVKEDFQQCMNALRAELTATSAGWENTNDDLKQKGQERDPPLKKAQTRYMIDTVASGPVDVMEEEGYADDHMELDEL